MIGMVFTDFSPPPVSFLLFLQLTYEIHWYARYS